MIRCCPSGSDTQRHECDATLPSDDFDTIEKSGWGWGWAADYGAESGQGPWLMCPIHCPQEARQALKETDHE